MRVLNAFSGYRPSIKGALSAIGDLLFPPVCIECGEVLEGAGGFVCDSCSSGIEGIAPPHCSICGNTILKIDKEDPICENCFTNKPEFDVALSAFAYGGAVMKAIKKFKYDGMAYLAGPLTALALEKSGYFWVNDGVGKLDPADFDLLVPVPLYKKRLYERGFNQALLISREMVKRWGDGNISINYKDLVRTRWTVPQTTLSVEERRINVKGAFESRGGAFYKKRVLLVDDVFTTGATVSECAGVLKKAGVKRIGVFTLARSVKR